MEEKNKFFLKKVWNYFSLYEKLWYGISMLTMVLLLVFFFDEVISSEGEESFLGNTVFCICTVVAIFANLTCELLLSKQSCWNFIVSVAFIEVSECIIYFSLGDYATALVSLCFWIPVDIISFVEWRKNKDGNKTELTKVRKLTVKQDCLLGVGVVIFTLVVGYLLTLIGGEETYADACVAGLGIVNGLLILFRFREQWVVWILFLIAEGVLLILNGHYLMLIKTVALLINSGYGLLCWTKYINNKNSKNS